MKATKTKHNKKRKNKIQSKNNQNMMIQNKRRQQAEK